MTVYLKLQKTTKTGYSSYVADTIRLEVRYFIYNGTNNKTGMDKFPSWEKMKAHLESIAPISDWEVERV